MTTRHHDNGCWLGSFRGLVLVECPRCASCAQLSLIGEDWFPALARVSCLHCGYSKEQVQPSSWSRRSTGPERGPYGDFPLWLQRPCCGQSLWAYNYHHLAYIASYVGAHHRMRNPVKSHHSRNSTMASRFPRWMIAAKNRFAILRAIQMLYEKRDSSTR